MSELNQVHQADLLRLMRLMTDIAALKSDPVTQRQSLSDGLQQLFKTKLGWVAVADNWRPGRRVTLQHQILTRSTTPQWLQYMSDFSVNNPIEADVFADYSTRSN